MVIQEYNLGTGAIELLQAGNEAVTPKRGLLKVAEGQFKPED